MEGGVSRKSEGVGAGLRVRLHRAPQACLEPTPSLALWEVVRVFPGNGAPGGVQMPHNRGNPEEQMFGGKVVQSQFIQISEGQKALGTI